MTEIQSFAAASDPNRQRAEQLAEGNGGTLGLTREQAEEVLKARGWTKPADSVIADAAAAEGDKEVVRLRQMLAANANASDAWKGMIEKLIAETAAVRARHAELKAGVKSRG